MTDTILKAAAKILGGKKARRIAKETPLGDDVLVEGVVKPDPDPDPEDALKQMEYSRDLERLIEEDLIRAQEAIEAQKRMPCIAWHLKVQRRGRKGGTHRRVVLYAEYPKSFRMGVQCYSALNGNVNKRHGFRNDILHRLIETLDYPEVRDALMGWEKVNETLLHWECEDARCRTRGQTQVVSLKFQGRVVMILEKHSEGMGWTQSHLVRGLIALMTLVGQETMLGPMKGLVNVLNHRVWQVRHQIELRTSTQMPADMKAEMDKAQEEGFAEGVRG